MTKKKEEEKKHTFLKYFIIIRNVYSILITVKCDLYKLVDKIIFFLSRKNEA